MEAAGGFFPFGEDGLAGAGRIYQHQIGNLGNFFCQDFGINADYIAGANVATPQIMNQCADAFVGDFVGNQAVGFESAPGKYAFATGGRAHIEDGADGRGDRPHRGCRKDGGEVETVEVTLLVQRVLPNFVGGFEAIDEGRLPGNGWGDRKGHLFRAGLAPEDAGGIVVGLGKRLDELCLLGCVIGEQAAAEFEEEVGGGGHE